MADYDGNSNVSRIAGDGKSRMGIPWKLISYSDLVSPIAVSTRLPLRRAPFHQTVSCPVFRILNSPFVYFFSSIADLWFFWMSVILRHFAKRLICSICCNVMIPTQCFLIYVMSVTCQLTWKIFIRILKKLHFSYRTLYLINVFVCRKRIGLYLWFFTRDRPEMLELMIERVARNNRYWCIEPSAMRHLDTTLRSFYDSFYLSHLLFLVRARRARGVTSTSRICNKEDRCDGRNIARS